MALDIQAFREAATQIGSHNLQVDGQTGGIVRGNGANWIKSLLNIGTAREENARTIEMLRQAVYRNPEYKVASSLMNALLNGISEKTPLTGRKIIQLLDKLDAGVSKAKAEAEADLVARNKERVYSYTMRQIADLDRYYENRCAHNRSRDIGLPPLSPEDKKALTLAISNRSLQDAGDFKNMEQPTGWGDGLESDIAYRSKYIVDDFIRLQGCIAKADVSPDIKATVKDQLFEDGELISEETLKQKIQTLDTLQANQALQQSLSDVSTGDTPLRTALSEAMDRAGIAAEVDDEALQGLAAAIRTAIDDAGRMGERKLSREEGEAIVQERVAPFVEARRAAAAVDKPAD